MTGAIPTIAEAAREIAAKRLSPVELTCACLERIHKLDGQLHAFVHLTEERALAEARAAEAAVMAGGPKGPLHGIPIGLKDIVDTKGIPTTCQSKILQDNIPDADAACAEKLAAAASATAPGGSIRGPAALCGIAGIKPTYGLVSRAGVAPAAFSLDHIGPMAWTAEDCALLLQALAGHDSRDPASAAQPIPSYTALLGSGIKGMRIG